MPRMNSALLLAAVLAACDEGQNTPSGPPTYHQDIAPLIERRCLACHQPGQRLRL